MNSTDQRLSPLATRTLRALYELAQCDRSAHVAALAERLGATPAEVVQALHELDGASLVTADNGRLTMLGLAWATRLPALTVRAPAQGADQVTSIDAARRARRRRFGFSRAVGH